MSDIKKLLSKSEEAGKPTEGERDLLIKSLIHQSALHNRQGDTALALLFTSAAQELERLQAENAEVKKQSEWISVDDELPEIKGDRSDGVLIRRDLGDGTVPTVCVSFLWSTKMQMHFSYNAPFEITDCWSKQESKGYRVTHWMPLPTPPKGE